MQCGFTLPSSSGPVNWHIFHNSGGPNPLPPTVFAFPYEAAAD